MFSSFHKVVHEDTNPANQLVRVHTVLIFGTEVVIVFYSGPPSALITKLRTEHVSEVNPGHHGDETFSSCNMSGDSVPIFHSLSVHFKNGIQPNRVFFLPLTLIQCCEDSCINTRRKSLSQREAERRNTAASELSCSGLQLIYRQTSL